MPRCRVLELNYCTNRKLLPDILNALAESRAKRAKLILLVWSCGSTDYLLELRSAMENNMDVPVRVYVMDHVGDKGKVLMSEYCDEVV